MTWYFQGSKEIFRVHADMLARESMIFADALGDLAEAVNESASGCDVKKINLPDCLNEHQFELFLYVLYAPFVVWL